MESLLISILEKSHWIVFTPVVIASLIGLSPTKKGHSDSTSEATVKTLRHLNNGALIFSMVMIIALTMATGLFLGLDYRVMFKEVGLNLLSHSWILGLAFVVMASFRYSWQRWITPGLSDFKKKISGESESDKLDDVRDHIRQSPPPIRDPRQFFIDGQIYVGNDDKTQEPIYLSQEDWHAQHMQIIGGTRKGKGVLTCTAVYQQILYGDTVIMIDPKPDKFQGHLMWQAALEAGREDEFIYVDLVNGIGGYNPFVDGTKYQRREKLNAAFGFNNTGDNSDHYKLKHRKRIEELISNDGLLTGHLATLHINATKQRIADEIPEDDLDEMISSWLRPSLCTLNQRTGDASTKGSFIPSKTIKKGGIVYVRSALNDAIVKQATVVMINDIVMQALSHAENRPHITLGIDESRVLISEPVVTALATSLGSDCNLILQQQAITDSRALNPDPSMTPEMAFQSITANTQRKFVYGGLHHETARYVEDHSGSIVKNVVDRESIESRGFGRKRAGSASLNLKEEGFFTSSKVLQLPPRTAVMMGEGLPKVIQTNFIPVTETLPGFTREQKGDGSLPKELLNYKGGHFKRVPKGKKKGGQKPPNTKRVNH